MNKKEATALALKNASKSAIKNQLDAFVQNWDGGEWSDEQKLTQGKNLLKVLNSAEGQDAIGAEEVKRLGSNLQFAMGNLFNDNPIQFGRDLPGFRTQVADTAKTMGDAITLNRQQISGLTGGGLKELVNGAGKKAQPKASSEDKKAVEWAQANPKDPRAMAILESNGIKQIAR